MKSTIRIDFIDRGTGKGIEPVIKVDIIKTEDPRDTLVSTLFQSVGHQSYLQLHYSNHRHLTTVNHLPEIEKTVILFKPEINTDELMSIVMDSFRNWLGEEKYTCISNLNGNMYTDGKDNPFTEDELFKRFISIKAVHSN